MYYINKITSISHQASFNNVGFSNSLIDLESNSEVLKPVYKEYINPRVLRRMSNILRMSVTCAVDCVNKTEENIDAIIVGTGLGCLTDTAKFLNNFITLEGLVPPTSFIQSTHNTIAGQVSLTLKNNGYNMTHTQNNVSFEVALEDAMICLDNGMKNVLLGAGDEFIPFLDEVVDGLELGKLNLTSGATFVVLSKIKNENTLAKVSASKTIYKGGSENNSLATFLEDNNVNSEAIDLVYYTSPFNEKAEELNQFSKEISINKYAGVYPTNSALGLHLAVDKIQTGKASSVLIYNNLTKNNLGLMLIETI